MEKIRTNALKKGDWVRLRNGWVAEIADNRRGNTRFADVYGLYREMGSVYSHDIVAQLSGGPTGGEVVAEIEYTPAQLKLRRTIARWDSNGVLA